MPEVLGVTRLQFQAGETIFDEGEDPEADYMIASGKVEIRLGVRGSNPRTLATLGRGQVFGELALFDGYVHMASAVAVQPTTVSAIERAQFESLGRWHGPGFARGCAANGQPRPANGQNAKGHQGRSNLGHLERWLSPSGRASADRGRRLCSFAAPQHCDHVNLNVSRCFRKEGGPPDQVRGWRLARVSHIKAE